MPNEERNRRRSDSEGEQPERASFHIGVMWFAEALNTVPRYGRVLVAGFLAVSMTIATFPLMGAVSWVLTGITGDISFQLEYVFTLDPVLLNTLFFVSAVAGLGFYAAGWRYYVGTAGETPTPTRAMVWYFGVGVLGVAVASFWLIRGVISLNTGA